MTLRKMYPTTAITSAVARPAARACSKARLLVILSATAVVPGMAHAQSIERYLPPAPVAIAPAVAPPFVAPADDDATPIGPMLRAIVILGPTDAPLPTSADGVDLSRAPQLIHDRQAFAPFLGRPLSGKLIAAVKTRIALRYRAAGRPFLSVSTPQQELTSGVLQVRIVEFKLGKKTAPGASPKDTPYIESRTRATSDQPINANELSQDIDWLNRFPFRRTEAVFTPGTGLGITDLQLQTAPSKPWSVYAGYANSGSPLTGEDRYFAGAQTILPWLHDAVASYQFTGSNDVLFDDDRLFATASDPRYLSHAGRLIAPTLPRQDIEASVSFVQSNQPVQDFMVRQDTYEATLAYRSALSNLWKPLPGELAVGVEAKRQTSRTLFGGTEVLGASFDVFQVTVAYAQQESDAYGRTSGDLTLHISPGSVDHRNTAAAFTDFSKGRFDQSEYGYISGDLNRYTRLPTIFGLKGFGLSNAVIGQYSAVALPLTEQIGLGNASLVRGYTLDDGAFDTALISRNELRSPAFTVLGRIGKVADQLSPYVFLDAGYGKDMRTKADADPISTGLGADYQMGSHLTATLDAAWALRAVGLTQSGDARIESRVSLAF